MHSKDGTGEKNEKDKKSRDGGSLNPQKKRLEQLRKRKEHEEAQREKHKNRSKPSREAVRSKSPRRTVKVSAEVVDCEYSAEEDAEDEDHQNVSNETLKKLLIDKRRLEKSLKLATENEKKLKSVLEVSAQWFDKYESMLDELDDQLTVYDKSRKVIVDNIINSVKPLCERWKESRKSMQAMKFAGMSLPSFSFGGNLAHYGVSILRQLLFAMAYCRDLISSNSSSDSPRTNSPKMVAAEK